jgi:hypothetical protein
MLAQQGRLLYSPFSTKQNPTNQPRKYMNETYHLLADISAIAAALIFLYIIIWG